MQAEIAGHLYNRAIFLLFFLPLPLICQTPTAISIVSSANPVVLGQRVTLLASINPSQAAGEVTFYDESIVLGIAPAANGSATLTTDLINPGVRSLTARFESRSGFVASRSHAIAITVNAVASGQLTTPVSYPTANANNQHIALADFNGDGHLDIVANNFTVLMGNGNGTFQPPVYYTSQSNAYGVATGDFNGDGKPDFASADLDGTLGVWLNKGDGTFLPPVFYQVGAVPLGIAVADFNNDGVADIAVASTQGDVPGIGVFIGLGDGTFKSPVNYLASRGQKALAIADFNGDGNADIVSADADQNVTIMLGAGDGTFRAGSTYNVTAPEFVAVGDFNKDGRPDFVAASLGGSLTVFLGNGDGTFVRQGPLLALQTVIDFPTDFCVSVGDFDGDGNPDIAYAGFEDPNVSIFIGNGDGTFRGAVSFPAGTNPQALVAAELNGDGRTDLAVTNSSSVQILLGGGGDFPTVTTTSVPGAMEGVSYSEALSATGGQMPYTWALSGGTSPIPLTSGGILQGTPSTNIMPGSYLFTVTVSGAKGPGYRSSQNLSIQLVAPFQITFPLNFLGEVGAPYSATLQAMGGTPPYKNWKVASGSLPPGVTLDPASGQFGGTPSAAGNFSFSVTVNDSSGLTSLSTTLSIVVYPALAIVTSSLPNGFVGIAYYVVLNATGGFPPYQNWAVGQGALPPGLTLDPMSGVISGTPTSPAGSPFSFTITIGSAGYDATSRAFTIGVANAVSTTMTLTSSANPSKLGEPVTLAASLSQPSSSGKVTFFDGSTVLGLANVKSGQARFTVNLPTAGKHLLQVRSFGPPASATLSQVVSASADASFLLPSAYASGDPRTGTATPVAIADFNGDGKPDLATFTSVLLGNGDGTFQAPLTHPFYNNAYSLIVADFNEDGIPDIAISEQVGVHILFGKGDGTFQTPLTLGLAAGTGFYGVMAAADFNGDGHVDLFVTSWSTPSSPSQVYLGVGDGTFRPPISVTTGIDFTTGIVAADFNGDGAPDLALTDGTSVYVRFGHGDGTFVAPAIYALGTNYLPPSGANLRVADLNGDGSLDLIAPADDKISVFLGRGDGTFRAPSDYVLDPNFNAADVAIGDFNGDGVPDLAIARYESAVTLMLGNGDGSFRAGPSFASATGTNFCLISTGDFNGDGIPDLVLGTNVSTVYALLGSSIAGANQATVSPTTLNVNVTPGGNAVTETVTLSYETTSQGSFTFSLFNFNSDLNWLSVSPSSGAMTLSSSSGSLYTYTAQVKVQINPLFAGFGTAQQTSLQFSINGAPAVLPLTVNVGVVPRVNGIVNAAISGAAVPFVIAPGGYITIYGTNLSNSSTDTSAASLPLSDMLNGTQVTIGELPMPLLYASSGQINALVPQELGPNNSYPLVVMTGTGSTASATVMVQELQPGIYTADQSGSGAGIVTNALTGQLINAANPAHAFDYLSVFCTGLGPLVGPNGQLEPADGAAAPTTVTFQTIAKVSVTIGGVDAPVLFSGLAPGFAGLYQVNIQVPAVSVSDAASLVIKATDSQTGAAGQSNPVTIAVQ
jgi:uncharacterized protein (TIGR03437 family)